MSTHQHTPQAVRGSRAAPVRAIPRGNGRKSQLYALEIILLLTSPHVSWTAERPGNPHSRELPEREAPLDKSAPWRLKTQGRAPAVLGRLSEEVGDVIRSGSSPAHSRAEPRSSSRGNTPGGASFGESGRKECTGRLEGGTTGGWGRFQLCPRENLAGG